jgi:hypothetical protein
MNLLLGVAALLRANHQNLFAAEACHAADHRRVVAKGAVAVNLAEVGEDVLNVIQRVGALGVAGQFDALPGIKIGARLTAQALHALMQRAQLALRLRAARAGLKLLDQHLDLFELLLRLTSCFHGTSPV